ncbi:hypothetical protein SRHO_G00210030 [Serrasalmus rhombeus]
MSETLSEGSEEEKGGDRLSHLQLKPSVSKGNSPPGSPKMSPHDSPRISPCNPPRLLRKLNCSITLQRRFTLAHTPRWFGA